MATKPPEPKVVKEWIRSVNAPMLHLYTNVWITADPKKIVIDDFVRAQLDAGKLIISEE